MPTHLCGFYQSVDPAGVYVTIPALADQGLFVSSNDLHVPELAQCLAIAAGVASGGQGNARLTSPSIRGVVRYFVEPVNGRNDGNVVADAIQRVLDLRKDPLIFRPKEIINADIHSDPTAAARQWVLLWLSDAPPAEVNLQTWTVRAVGTTVLVAGAWTAGTITLDDSLPAGRFNVVGFRARSTTLVAARLVFPGSAWRPGALGCTAQNDFAHPMFRAGGLGVLGSFDLDTIPQVEYLANAADAAETVYLDIVPA